MKRKNYPIVTVVVATLLIVVPLLLLSLSLHGRSTESDIASGELRDDNLHSSIVDPATSRRPVAATTESKTTAAFQDRSATQVAPIIAAPQVAPARSEPNGLPSLLTEVEVPAISPAGNDFPKPTETVVSEIPLVSEFMSAIFPQPAPVVAETAVAQLPTRPDAGTSYYEATGHLALRTQPQVPDPLANHVESPASPKESQAVADSGGIASEKGRKSKSRRSKSEETTSAETVSDLANSNPGQLVDAPRAGINVAADNDALIEDVVIQTPVESALVSRVENVVAMTRARGWPIALIRSNLPDDVWWVQQVVGIQGNSFAARVNFGNEYTLSGSAFSMVIVFLDSPDEVRRFRIAKQFKVIPEGVRHSREFHYIRN